MTYTQTQIELIDKYASLLFRISDIALLVDANPDELRDEISNKTTEISKIYYKAKLQVITRLRAQEIEQAELGSNTAIELVSRYIQEQQLDE